MSLRAYESYRESGVEWLGQVPTHWSVTRVKDVVDIINGYPFDSKLFDAEKGKPLLRIRDLNAREAEVRYFGEVEPRYEVTDAEVLIGMDGDFNVGRWRGDEPAILNQRVCALRTQSAALAKFLEHGLSYPLRRINDLTYSTTVKHLSSLQVGDIRIALPTKSDELLRLTAFLDRETGKIDALVEEQRRLIELLKEKRQAVISHAVTKGLNPSAPMKDSGVEWLGEVPAHWLVGPIRKAAKLESGHTPSRSRPEWWQDCSIPWFSLADVWQIREAKRDYIFDTKEMVSEIGLANSSARLLPANTVMLSRTASVGFSAIMGVPMATTQDFANWICGPRAKPEFLLQVLRAMSGEFRRLMMGSTHSTIYMPDIQSLHMALPPLAEQEAIVQHIKLIAGRYDGLTREAEAAIQLLQERRAALISAAVTGKIDVRSWTDADVRKAVAAEIIYLNARIATFGRVKNQKLIYLAEAHAGIHEIGGRYERHAAGPYDGDLMAFVEREVVGAGAVTVRQDARGSAVDYTLTPGWKPDRERLKAMLGDRLAAFEHANEKLADLDTRGAEAVATLYAVWNDALIDGEDCDDARVIRGFLHEWHTEKAEKFKEADLREWLGWMRRNGLTPEGRGPKTAVERLFK